MNKATDSICWAALGYASKLVGTLLMALLATLGVAADYTAQELKLTVGKSIVVDFPSDVARVSTSNPEVVDAVAVTLREILLNAKGNGLSTVVVWTKTGERSFYSISVEQNMEPLRKLLKETFPDEGIELRATRESISLTGSVSSQSVADRALALATPFAKAIVNNLRVAPPAVEKQVLLRVKFAEVNRNVGSSLGINLLSTGAANTVGATSTQQYQSGRFNTLNGTIPGRNEGTQSAVSLSDLLNIFMFRPDLNLAVAIKALQTQGLLQILAEPNLVTNNGKEASFLVGGEFPVPILQGGSNAGAITIQFREFGIRLTFLPVITSQKTIKLYVKPEVSTIDLANGVTFSGFTIPALATRRMETNIELGEGQSFAIAGLIDDRLTTTMMKIPGLSNIPILGSLFKSKGESKAKTELVVIVTPEVAYPQRPGDPSPAPAMIQEFLPPAAPEIKPGKSKQAPPKSQNGKGQSQGSKPNQS